MPQGKGTYGSKVGRPPKKAKKPAAKGGKKAFASTEFGQKIMAKQAAGKPAAGKKAAAKTNKKPMQQTRRTRRSQPK
jgi:hypothetical protein